MTPYSPMARHDDGLPRFIFRLTGIVMLMGLLAVSGCKGPEWARRTLPKVDAKHPAIVDEYCGRTRPVKESETVREVVTPGQTVYLPGDTLWVDCDSVVAAVPATVTRTVRVPCPPSSHRVDTFTRDRVVVKENTAARRAAEAQRDEARQDAVALKSQRNTARWAAGGLVGLILIWLLITRLIPRFAR